MLISKRIVTAAISFIILFFVFSFGALVIGGAVAGGIAGGRNPENPTEAGYQAGQRFAQEYTGVITLSSVGLSGVCSGILAFGGILPWCRRKQQDSIKHDETIEKGNV